MQIYQVGGSVRDGLLNLEVSDRDYVVVGARVEDMLKKGYKPVGKDFPVFLHPQTKEEYALARTERKTSLGYHGFVFNTSPDVTLEDDLQRRDLTINAIARDCHGRLYDPYHGIKDIADQVLRHVSPAFAEDPVRILRVARFAARFHALGFKVAAETLALMQTMVNNGEVSALVPERVWNELSKSLLSDHPAVFFEVLKNCTALNILFPEIEALYGVPQTAKWHPEIDTGVHTMMVLQQAVELTRDAGKDEKLMVRFAALVHDLGKALTPAEEWPSHKMHEHRGVPLVEALAQRLKLPTQIKDLAVLVTKLHLHYHKIAEMKASTILRFLENLDAFRRPQRFELFILACEADSRGRLGFETLQPVQTRYCRQVFRVAAAVEIKPILEQGYQGEQIKARLQRERQQAISAEIKTWQDA